MGSSIISGKALAVATNTGINTYLGYMGKDLTKQKELTNFDKGMKNITNMLIKYMIFICLIVLVIDGIIKNNFN